MLQHNAISPTGQSLCVYGDPAYLLRVTYKPPFNMSFKLVSLNDIFDAEWYLKETINMTIDNIIATVAF